MKFANDSLAYRKYSTTMTDLTNVQQPEDDFPVIRMIGRFMFYAEIGAFLFLGLLALLGSAVS
jgi:hypothetical protein